VKTALCLCGGGITGAVYELGALAALEDFFDGFDLGSFDLYVGTSAGAFVATLMAAGQRPFALARDVMDRQGGVMPADRRDIFRFDARATLGVVRDLARILGASLGRAARRRELALAELGHDLEDALPAGLFSLRHYERWLGEAFARRGVPTRFAELPRELYITANDLGTGHRAVFGEAATRHVPIPQAICASSAVPLFFEPVTIDGRDYIDGGAGKTGHLDVALHRGAELLVVVNPRVPIRPDPGSELPSAILGTYRLRDKGLLTVFEQAQRMSARTKLHSEIRRARNEFPAARVLLVEPQEHDADMLLANPMNFAARQRLLRYGYDSAARLLVERQDEFAAACARHGIRTRADRLRARPWERFG